MFRQLFIGNKDQDMSILLGDLDTKNFVMAKDNKTEEIVLVNKKTGVVIDRLAYDLMSEYLCAANGVESIQKELQTKQRDRHLLKKQKIKWSFKKTSHTNRT